MALVGNGFRLLSNPARMMTSGLTPQALHRSGWNRPGDSRNIWAGEATVLAGVSIANRDSIPSGARPPASWVLSPKAGGLASRNEVDGEGLVSAANLAGGLYGEATIAGDGTLAAAAYGIGDILAAIAGTGDLTASADAIAEIAATLAGAGDVSASINALGELASAMAGAGDLTGAMGLVVFAVATLSGSGSLDASMGLVVQAVATLSGSGTLSADVIGALALSASLAGSSDLVGSLGALADAVATLTGSGSLTGTADGVGSMAATITSEGELLTTGNVAAAVWNAVAASFVTAGSMGEALNTAGSGGLSPTQATMLLELYRLAGLDPTLPLVVTATTRKVPEDGSEIDQTVVEAPAGTITVERQ